MRGVVIALMMMAGAAMAQDDGMPAFDPSLLETCLDNASLRAEQGEERDAESCVGVAAEQCMKEEGGDTTAGMVQCQSRETGFWDARLNDAYAAAMAQAEEMDRINAKADPSAPKQAAALKQMQRDWIAFRDSSCAYERSLWGSGSGAAVALAGCALSITAEQALRLERYRER